MKKTFFKKKIDVTQQPYDPRMKLIISIIEHLNIPKKYLSLNLEYAMER